MFYSRVASSSDRLCSLALACINHAAPPASADVYVLSTIITYHDICSDHHNDYQNYGYQQSSSGTLHLSRDERVIHRNFHKWQ